jgi:hypothetical protein
VNFSRQKFAFRGDKEREERNLQWFSFDSNNLRKGWRGRSRSRREEGRREPEGRNWHFRKNDA